MAPRKPRDRPSARPRSGAGARPAPRRRAPAGAPGDAFWLYGRHPVAAALANPARRCLRLVAADTAAAGALPQRDGIAPERLGRSDIDALVPAGAPHQGVALLALPLAPPSLDAAIAGSSGPVVVLDRVADPRNAGAVLRSAAAFGAAAVIVGRRHAPPATGAMARAASGALEHVPLIAVANLARTLRALQRSGLWCIGLDAAAPRPLGEVRPPERTALVLGAEGAGLRRLVAAGCDELVGIPVAPAIASLNVGAAAAIALYALAGPPPGSGPRR